MACWRCHKLFEDKRRSKRGRACRSSSLTLLLHSCYMVIVCLKGDSFVSLFLQKTTTLLVQNLSELKTGMAMDGWASGMRL